MTGRRPRAPRGPPTAIPGPQYDWVRRHLPIVCIDLLPYREGVDGAEVGLLRRWFPEAGAPGARPVWCAVGGRLRHGETIRAALRRQLRTDLGRAAVGAFPLRQVPVAVVEYRHVPKGRGGPFDPRQHAIGLLYAVPVRGTVRPPAPHLGFRWFKVRALPPAREIGFGLSGTIRTVARALRERPSPRGVSRNGR
jgi:ADP-ribose pyrophosphatase YjhB (NUDIX family)